MIFLIQTRVQKYLQIVFWEGDGVAITSGFMFLFVCQQLVRDLHGKTKSRWVSDFGPFEEIFNGILIWLGAGDA